MAVKPRILFVYHHKYPQFWRDGLHAALGELVPYFDIDRYNIFDGMRTGADKPMEAYDFVLGWGAFGSPADNYIQTRKFQDAPFKKGLCIGGNATKPHDNYDVLFFETGWYMNQVSHKNKHHAFGYNADIYLSIDQHKLFDYIGVGSFSSWKRWHKFVEKRGNRIVIGESQRENVMESQKIIDYILNRGIAVCNLIAPEQLSIFLNSSITCYIPADTMGGGERAVLEARACGCEIEVEDDNPKLKELVYSDLYDHKYYAQQLKAGIESVL